ncbi:IS5 family transposase ISOt6 [Orientia tsutsugamushi]|nr:IS5 family transposase ISOt6 [Orientia tsutsugamushi]
MKFDQIKELKDEKFRRLTGVRKVTFSKMVDILRKADDLKKSKGVGKNKFNLEEQLLMALEYLREYLTYFHIGQNYWISESSAYKRQVRIRESMKSIIQKVYKRQDAIMIM